MRYRIHTIQRPRERAVGVGVVAAIDYLHYTFLEAAHVEKEMQNHLHGIHDVAAGAARLEIVGE